MCSEQSVDSVAAIGIHKISIQYNFWVVFISSKIMKHFLHKITSQTFDKISLTKIIKPLKCMLQEMPK